MPAIYLADRVLMRAAGSQAGHFLHGVVTCNVVDLAQGQARYGAMLQPQGKIIADFLLYRENEESFLLDAPAEVAENLLKRLTLLRLRAQLTLERLDDLAVAALFGTQAMPEGAVAYADPRLEALGQRLVMPCAAAEGLEQDVALYEAHRISLGIPRGGVDFAYGDAFPHEVDMDQIGGVDFDKGCYVGQEVVSRMEHRSTPRNRIVQALFPREAVAGGEILAGEKVAGRITSAAGRQAIATVRLDRTGDAQAKGVPLLVDGVEIELQRPAWAHFDMTWTRKESPLDTVQKAGG